MCLKHSWCRYFWVCREPGATAPRGLDLLIHLSMFLNCHSSHSSYLNISFRAGLTCLTVSLLIISRKPSEVFLFPNFKVFLVPSRWESPELQWYLFSLLTTFKLQMGISSARTHSILGKKKNKSHRNSNNLIGLPTYLIVPGINVLSD